MTSKEHNGIFDEATRIAGAYRAGQVKGGWEKPLVRGRPGCDPLGEGAGVGPLYGARQTLAFEPEPYCVDVADNIAKFNAPSSPSSLPADSVARKTYPMCTGLLDYFPDALAEIAKISYLGNAKHNPGEPLHHARGKSMDHADCIVRHLRDRGTKDAQGNSHTGQMAWRALALYQEELEKELGLPLPRGARDV